jgi:hypothetical protein
LSERFEVRKLRTALFAAESPYPLAALRIVVPAMILLTQEVRHAPALASAPVSLRTAPEGLGWFVSIVPIHPAMATLVQAVCAFSALAAMVGIGARVALVILTASTFYLFALSQLSGAVWHDMHLLWMSALLAASPSDEALAFDTKDAPLPEPSKRFGVPLTFARLLLGCIYFFPGVHKLATSGLAWALSDNLRNQLWWKWAEHGVVPALRVDRCAFLLHASGVFVLAFELAFPVLALLPRGRPWAAALGIAFHVTAGYFYRIPFVSLWALYVVLVDPTPVLSRLGRRFGRRSVPREPGGLVRLPLAATWIVGTVLVTGAFLQGLRGQMQSFPFACYPTFQWIVGTSMPDLLIAAVWRDGEEVTLSHARDARGYRTQREWGELWSVAGVTGPVNPSRLRAYVAEVSKGERARRALAGAESIRVYRASISVVPEERESPPFRKTLLIQLPLPE